MATHGSNRFELQALSERHKNVATLMAQGVPRQQIAEIVDYTPEYITMLTRDPLFKEHMQDLAEFHEARAELLFGKTVDVIEQSLQIGSTEEQLKAARLQLELTGRIGKNERPSTAGESSLERLTTLADRLVGLLGTKKGEVFDGQVLESDGNHA
jgi:hypothetical protein